MTQPITNCVYKSYKNRKADLFLSKPPSHSHKEFRQTHLVVVPTYILFNHGHFSTSRTVVSVVLKDTFGLSQLETLST